VEDDGLDFTRVLACICICDSEAQAPGMPPRPRPIWLRGGNTFLVAHQINMHTKSTNKVQRPMPASQSRGRSKSGPRSCSLRSLTVIWTFKPT